MSTLKPPSHETGYKTAIVIDGLPVVTDSAKLDKLKALIEKKLSDHHDKKHLDHYATAKV
jgi:hypothetical protein